MNLPPVLATKISRVSKMRVQISFELKNGGYDVINTLVKMTLDITTKGLAMGKGRVGTYSR